MYIIYNINAKCLINPNIADLDVDPALNPAKNTIGLEAEGEDFGHLMIRKMKNLNPNNPNPKVGGHLVIKKKKVSMFCLPLQPFRKVHKCLQFLEDHHHHHNHKTPHPDFLGHCFQNQ